MFGGAFVRSVRPGELSGPVRSFLTLVFRPIDEKNVPGDLDNEVGKECGDAEDKGRADNRFDGVAGEWANEG